ncbi:hypothetical protein TNCV_418091 [Trichonephila clavipes]|nr:hypothetical protein TNCV_418091 [Trichonephila clavipes]
MVYGDRYRLMHARWTSYVAGGNILRNYQFFGEYNRNIGLQTGRPGFDARCHQIPSECTRSTCSLNKWVRSLVGLFTSAGTGEYFPHLQFTCRNCGGGDRGRVAIYRPFGEVSLSLNRTVTCMVLSRPTTGVPLAHATMNFVGLVLTTSDRWH